MDVWVHKTQAVSRFSGATRQSHFDGSFKRGCQRFLPFPSNEGSNVLILPCPTYSSFHCDELSRTVGNCSCVLGDSARGGRRW